MFMQNKKIPTAVTLFKFLSLQNPGEKSGEIAGKRFIDHPLKDESTFLLAVEGLETQSGIDTAISTAVAAFAPLKSVKDVKAISPAMAKFGEWISNPKSNILSDEFGQKSEGLVSLTDAQQILLWDNLYYLAITAGDQRITDTVIKMIRGNNLYNEAVAFMLAHPEDPDDPKEDDGPSKEAAALMYDLVKASVLIPGILVSREKIPSIESVSDTMDQHQRKALTMLQDADVARFDIKRFQDTIDEIRKAKLLFDEAANKELSDAFKLYNESIRILIAAAPKDPDTGEIIMPELPEFVFESALVFDEAYLADKISEESLKKYLASKKVTHKTPDETLKEIAGEITQAYDQLDANIIRDVTIKAYNGLSLSVNNKPADNTLVMKAIKLYENEDLYAFFVTQYFENNDFRIKEIDFTLNPGPDGSHQFLAKQAVSESDSHVSYLLFPKGLELDLASGGHTFTAVYSTFNPVYTKMQSATTTRHPSYGDVIPLNTSTDGIPGNERVAVYGIKKIQIAEYNRVEQEIYCYVPGEVSHIENIMAREYKEKAARNLTRSEITTEESSEREVENLTDTTSTDRHELQSEISRVLQEDMSLQTGASVGVNLKTFSANANASFSMGSSETNSFNQAESFAQEVTERAMERIVEKVTYKRTSRMLKEYEETNKHGFDNRLGDKHVTGIYRWVDKIYKNTLVNYGKRLMYDFMIPEPAKNFKAWMTSKGNTAAQTSITKPENLNQWAYGPDGITRENYAKLASRYGADVEPPPASVMKIGKSFGDSPSNTGIEIQNRYSSGHSYKLEIPDGYECLNARYSYSHYQAGSDVNKSQVTVNISGMQDFSTYANARLNNYPYGGGTVDHVEKELEISLSTHQVGGFSLNVLANCYLKPEKYEAWRAETFLAIWEAYNKRLQEFNEAEAAANIGTTTGQSLDYNYNPMIGRAIEQRELKRACIEMMMRPFSLNIGQNHYIGGSGSNYKVNQTLALDKYADQVRFFEEAFDWDIISYMFFPYYWGKEADWSALIKEQSSADFIFQAFLQSGMGKVVLPVKPGFERAVLYFFDTGKVWFGQGYSVDTTSNLYQQVIDELRIKTPDEAGYEEPATWLTRIPSSLTIIQSDSAPLEENGLPCYCCEDGTPVVTLPGDCGCGSAGDDEPCKCPGIAQGNNLLNGNSTQPNTSTLLQDVIDIISNGSDIINAIKDLLDNGNNNPSEPPANTVCTEIAATLQQLKNSAQQVVLDYDNKVKNSGQASSKLTTYLAGLNTLLGQATTAGCSTTSISEAITKVSGDIVYVKQECVGYNNGMSVYAGHHASIMTGYQDGLHTCENTINALNTVLTNVQGFLTQATAAGCDLTAINAEIASLNADIASVQAACNPE